MENNMSQSKVVDLLVEYNQAYYDGNPIISDEEYDHFVKINQLGDYPSNFGVEIKGKVKLPTPIYGMDKIQKANEYSNFLKTFDQRKGVVISEKLDGITLLFDLTGSLVHVYTRGNVSESTGQIVDWILDAKLADPIKELFESGELGRVMIRGELIISVENFEKVSRETGIKNPLSFISGYVNGKDRNLEYLDLLDFKAFEIYFPDQFKQSTPEEQFDELEERGFTIPNRDFFQEVPKFDELEIILADFRSRSDYIIDGIIIAKNEEYIRLNDRNPQHAKAFKYIDTQIVKVIDVDWSVSKDMKLTPVIIIEPIEIDGKTYSKVLGKNAKEVTEKMIGPGAEIIMGANVVPVMYGVKTPAKELSLPKEEYTYDGVYFYLKESNRKVLTMKLVSFFSAIGAAGLKEGACRKLVEYGVDTMTDLIDLDNAIMKDIFGSTQGPKLLKEFQTKLSKATEAQLMNSSGLFTGIGEKTFTQILKQVSIQDLRTRLDKLSKPNDVGDVKWRDFKANIGEYFGWKDEMGLDDRDQYLAPADQAFDPQDETPIKQVKFILSGKPPTMTKAEFIKRLPRGYVEVSTVSKADVLIQSGSVRTKKTEDAEKKGVKIMDYEDFMV